MSLNFLKKEYGQKNRRRFGIRHKRNVKKKVAFFRFGNDCCPSIQYSYKNKWKKTTLTILNEENRKRSVSVSKTFINKNFFSFFIFVEKSI